MPVKRKSILRRTESAAIPSEAVPPTPPNSFSEPNSETEPDEQFQDSQEPLSQKRVKFDDSLPAEQEEDDFLSDEEFDEPKEFPIITYSDGEFHLSVPGLLNSAIEISQQAIDFAIVPRMRDWAMEKLTRPPTDEEIRIQEQLIDAGAFLAKGIFPGNEIFIDSAAGFLKKPAFEMDPSAEDTWSEMMKNIFENLKNKK